MVFNYRDPCWEALRIKVLRRDNWTCKLCGQLCLGKKKNGHSPVVDHIKPTREFPELGLDPNNVRVLCRSCDNKRHSEKGKTNDVPEVTADGFPKNSPWR